VHCLQRERGSSCHYLVSLRGEEMDSALLGRARADTDRALSSLLVTNGVGGGGGGKEDRHLAFQVTLSKIRNLLDHNRQNGGDGKSVTNPSIEANVNEQSQLPSVRRLLVSFSTLISAILHEFVTNHGLSLHHRDHHLNGNGYNHHINKGGDPAAMIRQMKQRRPHPGSPVPCHYYGSSSPFHRSSSHGNFGEINATGGANGKCRRRNLSDMDVVFENFDRVISDDDHYYHRPYGQQYHGVGGGASGQHPELLPRLESGVSLASDTTQEANNQHHHRAGSGGSTMSDEQNRCRQMNLLALLDIFVRLKESNGVERSSLTSMLVVRGEGEASRLLNDVALEVENQRRLLDELSMLPPGPMRNLVLELATMSPEMTHLQNLVLGGCLSLETLRERYDCDRLWDLITVYVDKLHSLELLIVEEIEFCWPSHCRPPAVTKLSDSPDRNDDSISHRSSLQREDNALSKLISDAFGSPRAAEDLLQTIQSLSSAEVKKRMLSALEPEPSEHPQDKYSKKGVDELLKELSKAPASKEWEIDIYEIRFLKRIGQGSAGTTYVADWSGLKVAVKVASITEMGLEGWRTEVHSLQKLHHPNVIRLLGSVYHAHPLTFCLVLEYCDGGDLASALCKVTPRNFFYHVSLSIAKGLGYLHNRGIIHRDVKPSNVLIQGDLSSGKYEIKITDFGVSTDLDIVRDRTAETGTCKFADERNTHL